MSRTLLLTGLAAFALASCGPSAPTVNTPPLTPEQQQAQAQCESAAYDTPEVKKIMQLRMSNDLNYNDFLPDQREAVRVAVRKCMQQKGLAPPGGVERVRTKPEYLPPGS
jgi:hypothetical protein